MLTLTLYTKPGCELCQHVRDDLDALADEFPHSVNEISILDDPQLFERYRHLIPVLIIGSARLIYPFSSLDIQVALRDQLPTHPTPPSGPT
jgi:hypothetical protein